VANAHLQALVRDGFVEAEGTTRARVYRLKTLTEVSRRYPREGLEEDVVWRELVAPVVARLPENVLGIWQYAVTEMINNAIDHSGAADVWVEARRNELATEVLVADEGEGIFVKIQRALGLVGAGGRALLLEPLPQLLHLPLQVLRPLGEALRLVGVGGTGVVAVLRNGPGPTVMIRADMDGLAAESHRRAAAGRSWKGCMEAGK